MKTVSKILSLCLCLVMLVGCFAACSNGGNTDGGETSGDASTDGTYVIGLSGPLTGGAAVYGTAVKNSAQMAVDEINEAGGLDGVKFTLVALNDEHKPDRVATNYAEMMKQGMHVSLGCVTTAPGLEFVSLSEEDNVFFLTPSASGDDIVAGDNGYQMCFADGNQGTVAGEYVNSLDYDKIGIFYKSDDAYSKGIYDKFVEVLDESIETVEASFTGEANDFTTQVELLKDCEFIFMPIYYTPASLFMTQAKGKVADDAIYYGCDGFDGIDSAEGFSIEDIPQTVSMLSHFNSKATEGKAAEFIAKYTEKHGVETLNQFGAAAYDCVYAIFEAMKAAKEAGEDVSPDMSASDLCEILKEQFNGGFTFSGNTGTDIKWESTGYVSKSAIAYVIKEAD